jgi:hypothetical protein
MKIRKFKTAVAMIELIFAIVIIGIVLLSTPMLIQQSVNSGFVALQQESISAISSHTAILLSKFWDEGDANNTAGVAPIITLNNPQPNSPFNLGGILSIDALGRTSAIGGVTLLASPIGRDFNETSPDLYDDIDDYDGTNLNLTIFNNETTTTDKGDYVDQNITISTRVTFANDRPDGLNSLTGTVINAGNTIYQNPNISPPNDSNIKFVRVNLSTLNPIKELEKNITLNAFSCNLGTYTLGEAEY